MWACWWEDLQPAVTRHLCSAAGLPFDWFWKFKKYVLRQVGEIELDDCWYFPGKITSVEAFCFKEQKTYPLCCAVMFIEHVTQL